MQQITDRSKRKNVLMNDVLNKDKICMINLSLIHNLTNKLTKEDAELITVSFALTCFYNLLD